MSGRRILAAALAGLGLVAIAFICMWHWVNTLPFDGEKKSAAHLEVVKIASAFAVALGGLGALYLTARRQRTQEQERAHAVLVAENNQRHADRVATSTERDSVDRQVTELYAKSVEQLGSEKAPVRLGGMYALERLAQNMPSQRQTIVNVLCAYLRMPYENVLVNARHSPPLRDNDIGDDVRTDDQSVIEEGAAGQQERQVRLTAQRIIEDHLRLDQESENVDEAFWPDIKLDLTGAALLDFDFSGCRVGDARFHGTKFFGVTNFGGARFAGTSDFSRSTFHRNVVFNGAKFDGWVRFDRATFSDRTYFGGVTFAHSVSFGNATFGGATIFIESTFVGSAWFSESEFNAYVDFESAKFDNAVFRKAVFREHGDFSGARFSTVATFVEAKFKGPVYFTAADFGLADFQETQFSRIAGFIRAKFSAHAKFAGAQFDSNIAFDEAIVRLDTDYSEFREWPPGCAVTDSDAPHPDGKEGRWAYLRSDSEPLITARE